MTLKDVWESKGLSSTQVAGQAGITVSTLLKLHRKDKSVRANNLHSVLRVLELSLDEYNRLDTGR